jgi:hypothetical protein
VTISLAFLAPDLVKAAIGGRLTHGLGVARLCVVRDCVVGPRGPELGARHPVHSPPA